jgi:tol-pal system protein YbgF
MRSSIPTMALVALVAACASTPPEQDPVQIKLNNLDERLARVERIAGNEAEMSQRLDQVQQSLREMRGRLDELEHNGEALTKQQRDLYADLDKRLAAASAAAGGPAGATPATGPAGGGAAGAAPTGGAADNTAEGGAAAGGAAAAGGNAPAAGGNAPSSTEQAVYSQAFDALKAGSYSVAITGFKDFLSTYPASPLAENAQYWLGEAYYVNKDYESAGGAFRTVLRKWPDSRKAPDALLKLGYTQAAQKQNSAARATLNEVMKKYPGSDAARLAGERLKRIPAQPAQSAPPPAPAQ